MGNKINVKFWGKSPNSIPNWRENTSRIVIINGPQSIDFKGYPEYGERSKALEHSIIEIEDENKSFIWNGTFDELIKKLQA